MEKVFSLLFVVAQMKYAVEGATSLQSPPPPLSSMVPTPEPTLPATLLRHLRRNSNQS